MDEKSNIRGATNVYILGSYGTNREWQKTIFRMVIWGKVMGVVMGNA